MNSTITQHEGFFSQERVELGENPAHLEPPPILLIEETCDGKSDGYFVKLKLCRDPASSMSYLYEFKISLFDHGEPEEFLLFIYNFNMTLAATGALDMGANVQYLRTIVHVEVLHQFDFFSLMWKIQKP